MTIKISMLALTYIMQVLAAVLAAVCLVLIAAAAPIGRFDLIAVQAFLFLVNIAIFAFQFIIRARLGG